jgi:hypothetical protein
MMIHASLGAHLDRDPKPQGYRRDILDMIVDDLAISKFYVFYPDRRMQTLLSHGFPCSTTSTIRLQENPW